MMDQEKSNGFQEQKEVKNRKKQPLPNPVTKKRCPTNSIKISTKIYRPYFMKANRSQSAISRRS